MALWGSKKPAPKKTPTRPPAGRTARSTPDDNLTEMFDILRECCAHNVPAVIISPDNNLIFEARFATDTDGLITFEVLQEKGTVLRSLSTCCVSYFREGRAFIFLSVVQGYHHLKTSDRPRLTLSHPTQITATDVRRAFRVPVPAEIGLTVNMVVDGQKYSPRPGDISFGGMMVVFPENDVPDLAVGQTMQMNISLEGNQVDLKGELRQRFGDHKNKFGVFFPDCYHGEAFHPPEAYRRIVMGTEKAWLKHRNR